MGGAVIDCAAGVSWWQDDRVDCPVVVAEKVLMAVVSEGEVVVDVLLVPCWRSPAAVPPRPHAWGAPLPSRWKAGGIS